MYVLYVLRFSRLKVNILFFTPFLGMVRFDTNPERFASVNMLKKLESSIKESIRLDAQILAMDEEILLNPVNMIILCVKLISL